jgi:hypothetical protein
VRWLETGRTLLSIVILLKGLSGIPSLAVGQNTPGAVTIFDSDPSHIWNRTYACLFIRQALDGQQYGADALDPLLWPETRYFLMGDSHRRAVDCLDEFLRGHAEHLVTDPLKRAIMQRDLWAVFDWAAGGDDLPEERRELEAKLAEAIRRMALAPEEVRGLPDTYADAVIARQFGTEYDPHNPRQPFLPPELFRSDGPWICLSSHSNEPTAIVHFSGRSRFIVFMRLPGGRDATLAYLHKLRLSSQPALIHQYLLNLNLPQFPAGTQVALVRQAILIDRKGQLVATTLTESVQLRMYHAITPGNQYMNYINGPSSHDQDFFEFRMSRPELFAAHNGGLVAVSPEETEFATFATHGIDAFETRIHLDERGVVLARCRACHSDSGIHSVQSRIGWMNDTSLDGLAKGRTDSTISWETRATITRKEQQSDFKLLRKLWGAPAITASK